MKLLLTFLCLCVLIVSRAQDNDEGEHLNEKDSKFISSRNADSLIKACTYYQVSYTGWGYADDYCMDSLSKKFNFESYIIFRGDLMLAKSVHDSVDIFNKKMEKMIAIIDGKNWKRDFDWEYSNCSCCLCGNADSFDKYLASGIVGYVGFRFEQNKFQLNAIQKCIIDHGLLRFMKGYPKYSISLSGHSDPSELDTSKALSRKRAESLRSYLVSKGVNKDRIEVLWYGSEKVVTDDKNYPEMNRRVNFAVHR